MVNWYMKGQSNYDDSGYFMWLYLDHNGFAEGNYGSQVMETHGETSDPFMAFGVDTGPATWTYGQQQVEIGLLKSYRIKIDTTGIFKWIGPGQDDWESIGGSLGSLNDLDDVIIDAPADNEVLAWNNATSKWINQTAAQAGLSAVGHTHNDLYYTEGEVDGLLHSEAHDLASHTTKAHSELSDAPTSAHHIKFSNADAVSAVATADDYLKNDANDTMNGDLTVNNLITAGNVDTVDVSAFKTAYDSHDGGIIEDKHDLSTLVFGDIANMAKFTNAEAVTAVATADVYLKLVGDTMGGAINMGASEINNATYYKVDSGDGKGLRFWNGSSNYCIYMSQQTDGTYGGRADATSDYNMYFNMVDGDNRGFQFCDGLKNPYFAITPDTGVWTDVDIILKQGAGVCFDAEQNDGSWAGDIMLIDTTGCNTFDLVYIDAYDSVAPADASDDTKMPAIGIVVAAGKVLTHGVVKDDNLIVCTTAKAIVYASTVLRKVQENAPNQAGEMIQVVGICVGDHTLFVNVSLDMVEFV